VAEAGETPALAIRLADIFAWDIDFIRDIRVGDTFVAVVEKRSRDGQFVGYGRIEAAQFVNQGEAYHGFLFADAQGNAQYFDEQGRSLRKAFLKAPLNFTRISSGFTLNRLHPVLGYRRPHPAIAYAAPMGTPVKTVGDGVVLQRGWDKGGGNYIKIRHNGVYETVYMHLKGFAKGIANGARVRQGQVIGYVGSTGMSTGPHLDFRMKKNGTYINPRTIKSPPADPVARERMAEFMSHIQPLMARCTAPGCCTRAGAPLPAWRRANVWPCARACRPSAWPGLPFPVRRDHRPLSRAGATRSSGRRLVRPRESRVPEGAGGCPWPCFASLGHGSVHPGWQLSGGSCPTGRVAVERFFWEGGEAAPRACDSGRPLADFPVIAFSLNFEEELRSLVEVLDRAGIPARRAARGAGWPLVMAGGPLAFLNPAPAAPAGDLFWVGEAEAGLPEGLAIWPARPTRARARPMTLGRPGRARGRLLPGTPGRPRAAVPAGEGLLEAGALLLRQPRGRVPRHVPAEINRGCPSAALLRPRNTSTAPRATPPSRNCGPLWSRPIRRRSGSWARR
jgi:murein DD-endopeptidase MepM/ murein hydrolase activator NlpD